MKKPLPIVFLFTLAATNVFAQSNDSVSEVETQAAKAAEGYSGYESAAWAAMQKDLLKVVSADVASSLTLIAYRAVAEILCDGVVDMAKVKKKTLELHPENWDELSDEEHTRWNHTILVNYGMIVGVMLAEHADNAGPSCAEVNELIADKSNTWHYFYVESEE